MFKIVEGFFRRGTGVVEDRLLEELETLESVSKRSRSRNGCTTTEPCNRVQSLSFPVRLSVGSWEVVKGCRARTASAIHPAREVSVTVLV